MIRKLKPTNFILILSILTFSSVGLSQSTYGPGNLPNHPARIDEKAKTTALVIDVYPDENLIKVKDEITNEVSTYKVSANAEISGDKGEFGKKHLTIKDVPKDRRVKLVYFKAARGIAQEIEILKKKDK